MLNSNQIIEEGLLNLKNAKGKPAQVGYDITLKAVNRVGAGNPVYGPYKIGKVLKDKMNCLNFY